MKEEKENKRIRMIIYKVHDYDLLMYACSLKDHSLKNAKISFYSVVKALLNQYVGKQTFVAPKIKNFTRKNLPSKMTVRFTLDESEDKELIELFKAIKPRQRNSFLKNFLRRNLNLEDMDCYFEDGFDVNKLNRIIKKTPVKVETDVEIEEVPKEEIHKPEPMPKKEEKITEFIVKEVPKKETPKKEENNSFVSTFDPFEALGSINY